jgi:hypothetical protein
MEASPGLRTGPAPSVIESVVDGQEQVGSGLDRPTVGPTGRGGHRSTLHRAWPSGSGRSGDATRACAVRPRPPVLFHGSRSAWRRGRRARPQAIPHRYRLVPLKERSTHQGDAAVKLERDHRGLLRARSLWEWLIRKRRDGCIGEGDRSSGASGSAKVAAAMPACLRAFMNLPRSMAETRGSSVFPSYNGRLAPKCAPHHPKAPASKPGPYADS